MKSTFQFLSLLVKVLLIYFTRMWLCLSYRFQNNNLWISQQYNNGMLFYFGSKSKDCNPSKEKLILALSILKYFSGLKKIRRMFIMKTVTVQTTYYKVILNLYLKKTKFRYWLLRLHERIKHKQKFRRIIKNNTAPIFTFRSPLELWVQM